MGFFSDQEMAELRINRMILHVVSKSKEDFVAQSEMDLNGVDHLDFFLARLFDAAIDSVHEFKVSSDTRSTIEQIASGVIGFEKGAQDISRRFDNVHPQTATSGAFFVFELVVEDPSIRLYGMMKYDYRQAVELYEKQGRNALRQIVQAFVQEKGAIQKAAIVRTRNGVAEPALSARDRMGNSPDLTDYFEAFLDVKRERNNAQLSEDLRGALRSVVEDLRDYLPDRDVPAALRAAKEALQGREVVDESAVKEALFVAAGRPQEEEIRAAVERAVTRHLKAKKLNGVTFKPHPAVLRTAARRRIRTAEGVVIEFPGDQEDKTVRRRLSPDGGATITVQTEEKLVEDGTLPDRSRDRT
ncbi:hypothetical protein [Ancylobacter sp.]|uniref:hypothetical protein n=1 Tax=Ancylobacter sp. TaxID=1872567 RepID=UPI003D132D73